VYVKGARDLEENLLANVDSDVERLLIELVKLLARKQGTDHKTYPLWIECAECVLLELILITRL
jgi:hypothetical protein